MEFYKILLEIMNEKGLSIPDIARACDLTDSTVRSIIDRKQKKVALNVAFKLHDGLKVSLERLNGEKEKAPTISVSASLQHLTDNFDKLNEEGQEKLVDYSDDLIASGRYIKNDEFKALEEEA